MAERGVFVLESSRCTFHPKQKMDLQLQGKRALVTGSTAGIGLAIAGLGERGCSRHREKRNWGRIVFISSESAIQIPAEMIHYGMTKTVQLAIARGLAETTAGTNVTVNSVLPGPTASEGASNFIENLARDQKTTRQEVEREFFRNMRPTSLLKRMIEPEEVANLVTFVCSPLSSAINGAALRADGGVVRSIV